MAPKSLSAPAGRARYASVLGGLSADRPAATRGANETRVYQAAAQAVVLVVAKDGLGSGVLVSADGKIVTNLHVVGDDDEVGVVFKPKAEGAAVEDADVRAAKVIRRDELADLALLQVSETPAGVTPLALGASNAVEVGSDVHAIGHPTGQTWTYTRGIVSQIRKDYNWRTDGKVQHKATVVQTQTPINPGNSGGPLLDDKLEVVGINSFKGDGEGLNFAVSAEDVKAFLARTGDRMIDPAEKAKAEAACEPVVLDERPSKDQTSLDRVIDTDCDGEGDLLVVEPTNPKGALLYLTDDNGDGKLDTVYVDDGRDGDFDLALIDTDGDGEPDLEGKFKRGEDEPYRYNRIRK